MLADLMNRLTEDYSEKRKQHLVDIFTACSRYEAAFWDKFASIYGKKARADEPLFVDFYANEFNRAQSICGHDPRTAEIVRSLQKRGY